MSKRSDRQSMTFLGLFEEFVHSEVAGSVVLLACTVTALVWANSPWAESYFHILHTKIGLSWGSSTYALTLHHWINDGLMAIFFFVVGLEVKRELVVGHLSSVNKAIMPVAAALGGMVVPAAVYVAFNLGGEGSRGWGIPMATDIAFALGILAMFGRRVPIGLKVFLAAAAIADDIGAVLVIALFYTETIHVTALVVAAVFLSALFVATRMVKTRRLGVVLLLIFGVWVAVLASGVHATVAGILLAFLVPVRSGIEPGEFLKRARERITVLEESELTSESAIFDEQQLEAIVDLHEAAGDMAPPGLVLEHYIHPFQAFFVLPLFALANAGVAIGADVVEMITSPVGLGIIVGLVVGKQIGITLCSWLITKASSAAMPEGVTWPQIYGVGCLAGIGFTMSLFVSELAFKSEALVGEAKVGILVGSLISAVIGLIVLHKALPKE